MKETNWSTNVDQRNPESRLSAEELSEMDDVHAIYIFTFQK
jgi:hypothetical protein